MGCGVTVRVENSTGRCVLGESFTMPIKRSDHMAPSVSMIAPNRIPSIIIIILNASGMSTFSFHCLWWLSLTAKDSSEKIG
jgi:hypothetical protein